LKLSSSCLAENGCFLSAREIRSSASVVSKTNSSPRPTCSIGCLLRRCRHVPCSSSAPAWIRIPALPGFPFTPYRRRCPLTQAWRVSSGPANRIVVLPHAITTHHHQHYRGQRPSLPSSRFACFESGTPASCCIFTFNGNS